MILCYEGDERFQDMETASRYFQELPESWWRMEESEEEVLNAPTTPNWWKDQ